MWTLIATQMVSTVLADSGPVSHRVSLSSGRRGVHTDPSGVLACCTFVVMEEARRIGSIQFTPPLIRTELEPAIRATYYLKMSSCPIALLGWCSWLSRLSNTRRFHCLPVCAQKVPSSSLDPSNRVHFFCSFPCSPWVQRRAVHVLS